MRIAVGLVFVVMGVEANEIFFDEEFQLGVLVEHFTSTNAHFLTVDPSVNDPSWNANGYAAALESPGELIALGRFKFVREFVIGRSSKPDFLLYQAGSAKALDFRPAKPEAK